MLVQSMTAEILTPSKHQSCPPFVAETSFRHGMSQDLHLYDPVRVPDPALLDIRWETTQVRLIILHAIVVITGYVDGRRQ